MLKLDFSIYLVMDHYAMADLQVYRLGIILMQGLIGVHSKFVPWTGWLSVNVSVIVLKQIRCK